MAAAMTELWNERVNAPPAADLISMLAHGEATRDMDPVEFMGNCVLLIVGGNDTTRNSISGGLWALNKHPDEYRKLRENPGLIPSMVPEIIRWQTPIAICGGPRWRIANSAARRSGRATRWRCGIFPATATRTRSRTPIVSSSTAPRPRQHLSFGFGIHRCVGNRLAEMQLTILWEEIMKRFP